MAYPGLLTSSMACMMATSSSFAARSGSTSEHSGVSPAALSFTLEWCSSCDESFDMMLCGSAGEGGDEVQGEERR